MKNKKIIFMSTKDITTKKKLVPLRIEESFHKELKKRAFGFGISVNMYMCKILEDHITKNRKIIVIK